MHETKVSSQLWLQPLSGLSLRVRWLANDAAPLTVFWQSPPAGTVLTVEPEIWVSVGGPIVALAALPLADRAVAERLKLDGSEPLQIIPTAAGPAYKVDLFLFAHDCRAVDLAYRTSIDPSYSDVCASLPGRMLGR